MPIYEDIARDLLEAIQRGQYPVGGLIPTELELAARYDVSRQTVRAAIADSALPDAAVSAASGD